MKQPRPPQYVPLRFRLVRLADAYAAAKGISRATVSTLVFNGGHVLERLACGKGDCSTGNFERALVWFSANWPRGTKWPAEIIARPDDRRAA